MAPLVEVRGLEKRFTAGGALQGDSRGRAQVPISNSEIAPYCPQRLFGIVIACSIDLDNLVSDDLANGIVTINETQRPQRKRKGAVEPFHVFSLDLAVPEHPVDRHPPSPPAGCDHTWAHGSWYRDSATCRNGPGRRGSAEAASLGG